MNHLSGVACSKINVSVFKNRNIMIAFKPTCHLSLPSFSSEFQSVLCNWLSEAAVSSEAGVQIQMKTVEASSCTSCNILLVRPDITKLKQVKIIHAAPASGITCLSLE